MLTDFGDLSSNLGAKVCFITQVLFEELAPWRCVTTTQAANRTFFSTFFGYRKYMSVGSKEILKMASGAHDMALAVEIHLPVKALSQNQTSLTHFIERAAAGDT